MFSLEKKIQRIFVFLVFAGSIGAPCSWQPELCHLAVQT